MNQFTNTTPLNTRSLIDVFQSEKYIGKIVYLGLFLMPIFLLSVRHWLSGWFSLLALLALGTLYLNFRHNLAREEKLLIWIFAIFLAVFFISASLNGWTESSYRRIGTELKYLLFIPLYFLIRRYHHTVIFFLAGIALGGIVLGLQAVFDTFFTGKGRGWGIYGPIVFGDLSSLILLFSIVILVYRRAIYSWRRITGISIIFSLLAVYLSSNRNGWLATIILLLLLPMFWPKRTVKTVLITYLIISLLVISGFFVFQNKFTQHAQIAIHQLSNYFAIVDTSKFNSHKLKGDSVGFRLEQWRVALIVFRDAPWFGHGPGNAARAENEYVKRGIGHPDLYNPKSYTNIGGLHSTYFETLVNQGIVGVIVLALFLGYPLYNFIRYRSHDRFISSLGIILILGYMIFGLTENPFVHDNYSSFYLITLAVLFSTMMRRKSDQTIGTARA